MAKPTPNQAQLTKELAEYKRARRKGLQPPSVKGVREWEAQQRREQRDPEREFQVLLYWPHELEENPDWQPLLAVAPYRERLLAYFVAAGARDWWASGYLVEVDGQAVIAQLVIEPNTDRYPDGPPNGGIKGSDLRELRFGTIEAAVRSRIRREPANQEWTRHLDVDVAQTPQEERALRKALAAVARRKSEGEARLRDIAHAYLQLAEQGVGRGRRKLLAQAWGLSESRIRDLLHQAKEAGYLAGGTRGKASYVAGPQLTAHEQENQP